MSNDNYNAWIIYRDIHNDWLFSYVINNLILSKLYSIDILLVKETKSAGNIEIVYRSPNSRDIFPKFWYLPVL
jgi:hypothetical protein